MLLPGMVRMQQLIDALVDKVYDAQVYMYRIKGVTHAYETLIQILASENDYSEQRHILLDMPLDQIEELLNAQVDDKATKYLMTTDLCHD